jgi:condensin complex subunit 2
MLMMMFVPIYCFLFPSANINLHKLDAAFDIDPLFHKMSKTFDEGGAKGLLLANLGVSYQGNAGGCKIIFDSSLDDDSTEDEAEDAEDLTKPEQTSVDVSSLAAKIDSLLAIGAGHSCHTMEDMPLVPQLASLRMQFSELERGGFVDQQVVSVSSMEDTVRDTIVSSPKFLICIFIL